MQIVAQSGLFRDLQMTPVCKDVELSNGRSANFSKTDTHLASEIGQGRFCGVRRGDRAC